MSTATDTLTLYTNRKCPWAHRAHIALNELKVPFEEVTIPLDRPRDPWYLEVNPRGLVPTIKLSDGTIIAESGIVGQYLADAYPSDLVPASNAPGAALTRAKINFFVDTFASKFNAHTMKVIWVAKTAEESEEAEKAALAGAVKEVEPLLADAGPFFGGSDKLTLAEVLTGSFVQRLLVSIEAGGIFTESFVSSLQEQTPNFWKWAKAVAAHPSVTGVLDEKWFAEWVKDRIATARA